MDMARYASRAQKTAGKPSPGGDFSIIMRV